MEFKSFDQISRVFEIGRDYSVFRTAAFKRAQHKAGERFREFFRDRIRQSGPGWAPLAESTIQRREAFEVAGGAFHEFSDDPLWFTEQLLNAIDYQVKEEDVLIGVKAGVHEAPDGHMVELSDLIDYSEMGTPTEPPRPIFTHPDFYNEQEQISLDFAKDVVRKGIMKKIRRGK